jgi:hypothetical protein
MMELAVNRKTLKIEFEVTAQNHHHDLVWVIPVLGFNADNQTLKTGGTSECLDFIKFNKKYRIMKVY